VVALLPKLTPVRHTLANALLSAGRRYEAIEQFNEILRFEPDYAPAKDAIARIRVGK